MLENVKIFNAPSLFIYFMELEGFSICFIKYFGVTWPFTLEEKVVNRFLNL